MYCFEKDRSFVFESFTDNANQNEGFITKGVGYYSVNKNELTLTFTKYNEPIASSIQLIDTTCSNDGKIDYFIEVTDIDYSPLIAVNILYSDGLKSLGGISDINGRAIFSINADADLPTFKLSYMGFENIEISITDRNCKKIVVVLTEKINYIAPDITKSYKYKFLNETLLLKIEGKKSWHNFYKVAEL
jgi:hypothetical protein